MIISDDGSTDTEEYVKSLKINFNLIYYMYLKKILALDHARNNGVKNSKGELIVLLILIVKLIVIG